MFYINVFKCLFKFLLCVRIHYPIIIIEPPRGQYNLIKNILFYINPK